MQTKYIVILLAIGIFSIVLLGRAVMPGPLTPLSDPSREITIMRQHDESGKDFAIEQEVEYSISEDEYTVHTYIWYGELGELFSSDIVDSTFDRVSIADIEGVKQQQMVWAHGRLSILKSRMANMQPGVTMR